MSKLFGLTKKEMRNETPSDISDEKCLELLEQYVAKEQYTNTVSEKIVLQRLSVIDEQMDILFREFESVIRSHPKVRSPESCVLYGKSLKGLTDAMNFLRQEEVKALKSLETM